MKTASCLATNTALEAAAQRAEQRKRQAIGRLNDRLGAASPRDRLRAPEAKARADEPAMQETER